MTQVQAVSALSAATVGEFAADFQGHLVGSTDPNFDAARALWNGMIDHRPELIAQCTGVADVLASIRFARDHGLPVSVMGGRHSVAGRSCLDGALLIDLGAMRWARVDVQQRTVRVGPGTLGGEMDRETQAFGLATTGGTDSSTGVIGLTLGGGMGFLGRRFGLAIDNLVGAEVVLADGRVLRVSATDHPDLFWALRGGGGGLGVVTEMELQLHPVGPQLAVAQVFLPWKLAGEALRFYRDFTAGMAPEIGCYLLAANVPPADPFPREYQGTTAVVLAASHCGDLDEGLAALAPMTKIGDPIFSMLAPLPYTALQQSFDAANPAGKRFFWKSEYLSELPDEALETFISHADPLPGPFSAAFLEALGGAMADRDAAATAFPHRGAAFNFAACAGWEDAGHDEAAIAWVRGFHEAMTPFGTGGVYANYVGLDDVDRPQAVFGLNNARLASIRAEYDPEGLFAADPTPGI